MERGDTRSAEVRIESRNIPRIAIVVVGLGVAWTGFRLVTHRNTGILRMLARARHSYNLRWILRSIRFYQEAVLPDLHIPSVAGTSEVAGYNVYRRDPSGFTRINAALVADTN